MSPEKLNHIAELCRLSLAIATPWRGQVDEILDAMASKSDIEPGVVAEVILQGIPYSGIPGAVEALLAWRHRVPGPRVETKKDDGSKSAEVGAELFQKVYGDIADQVRTELRNSHPTLERWVIEFAYGRVMGRNVLPLHLLEVLGVASLLGQERAAPLHSHIRGALRTGWNADDLEALLMLLEPECRPQIHERALESLGQLRKR